jgi:hypothetical protein
MSPKNAVPIHYDTEQHREDVKEVESNPCTWAADPEQSFAGAQFGR